MTAALVIAVIAALALARRAVADAARMRLVAEAEHELRAPLQAIVFALAGRSDLDPELERARVALADLAAARGGRRSAADDELVRLDRVVWRAAAGSDLAARRVGGGVQLDWAAGPVSVRANRGRVAQVLGNLLANAIEHGGGEVRLSGRRTQRGVRIEVRDTGRAPDLPVERLRAPGRGHGLRIAAKSVREIGGSLRVARAGSGMAFSIELPVVDAEAPAGDPYTQLAAFRRTDPPAAA